ncbi:hypothetical protein COU54_04580 [Candidatus Pacearchaeota archaeon CG10_big_fil_rev_8_21_14_0_10_31_24]|nr:MAG: hypothetical protein COU54_04580 [Candidatus Pacearchaeota archaeon CG10_big_fil_rev_8_21_14_0_10_31_24]
MKSDCKRAVANESLVYIILGLAGFFIIGVLIFNFYNSDAGTGNSDVCHLSVITRATSPEATQNYVPLKCQTQKVCINDGTGKCDYSFAGEKISEVKVDSKDQDEVAREIERVSAEAMYDCWNMMGEGRLDLQESLSKKGGFESAKSMCVICNRIALDLDKDKESGVLSKVNLESYLKGHQIPGSEKTYLQAFTDESINSYQHVDLTALKDDLKYNENEAISLVSSNHESAVVFMQIKTASVDEVLENLGKAGLTIVGGTLVSVPTLALSGAKYVMFSAVGAGATLAGAGTVAGFAWYNVEKGQSLAIQHCGDLTSSDGQARKGCSVVQVVPYDAKELNKICGVIESAP